MIRAFVALRPPDPVCDRLEDLALDLTEAPGEGRPVRWENLHLTLAFLGEAPGNVLEDVAWELHALRAAAPVVEIAGVGAFGAARPRSAHALVRPNPALSALHDEVRRAARRGGLDLPRERFAPHITVARFPPRATAGEGLGRWFGRHAGFACAPFTAGEALMMRSDLGRDGPRYAEMMTIPLRRPEATASDG